MSEVKTTIEPKIVDSPVYRKINAPIDQLNSSDTNHNLEKCSFIPTKEALCSNEIHCEFNGSETPKCEDGIEDGELVEDSEPQSFNSAIRELQSERKKNSVRECWIDETISRLRRNPRELTRMILELPSTETVYAMSDSSLRSLFRLSLLLDNEHKILLNSNETLLDKMRTMHRENLSELLRTANSVDDLLGKRNFPLALGRKIRDELIFLDKIYLNMLKRTANKQLRSPENGKLPSNSLSSSSQVNEEMQLSSVFHSVQSKSSPSLTDTTQKQSAFCPCPTNPNFPVPNSMSDITSMNHAITPKSHRLRCDSAADQNYSRTPFAHHRFIPIDEIRSKNFFTHIPHFSLYGSHPQPYISSYSEQHGLFDGFPRIDVSADSNIRRRMSLSGVQTISDENTEPEKNF